MTAASSAVDTVLDHLDADIPRYLPLVPGRTELDLAITLDSGNHYLHCCRGTKTETNLRFTVPSDTKNIDYLAVVTDEAPYIVDTAGLDVTRETIISPAGQGVWTLDEWVASNTAR